MSQTHVTMTTLRSDRRYSGVRSAYLVRVRGVCPPHRNAHSWRDRGRYMGANALREAEVVAERIAHEPGAVEVLIEEIQEPSGMPLIMDAAQDYGVPDGWVASSQRVLAIHRD